MLALIISVSFSVPLLAQTSEVLKYQKQILDNPKDVAAHLRLALAYTMEKNYVGAVRSYFDVLKLEPDNFHAYNNLGILYKQSGQYQDSIQCYLQAQRLNPDSYWVPYNMGLCYEAMLQFNNAKESYGRALSLNPSFTQALNRLRVLNDPNFDGRVANLPPISAVPEQPQTPVQATQQMTIATSYTQKTSRPVQETKPAQTQQIQKKTPAEPKKQEKIFRFTSKTSAAAKIFNQAMEAFKTDDMPLAIQLYVTAVTSEPPLLSESDNGLIKAALTYLKDRPNRITNGLYYRGMLIHFSGYTELAVVDLRSYTATHVEGENQFTEQFLKEAQKILDVYDQEQAQIAAIKEEKRLRRLQEQEERAAMEAAKKKAEQESSAPSSYTAKRMSEDEILYEGDKLLRETKHAQAIEVLKIGLRNYPDSIPLLSKTATAYSDLFLIYSDQQAGNEAVKIYQEIVDKAPSSSNEKAIAEEMLRELSRRIR
ncbi:MAG: tetratricopeptide repeat protein [Candidatus Riflebacteria bacterium]|nr:tetratricopeptide repeat protein [Candidatus Riflebacteria bacterium]